MRLFVLSLLLFSLTCTTTATAQLSYDEFEWNILCWLRSTRVSLLAEIAEANDSPKSVPDNLKKYANYKEQDCSLDGAAIRTYLDTFIHKSDYPFVQYIYTRMRDIVPNEEVAYLELAKRWTQTLYDLEKVFIDVENRQQGEPGFVSKVALKRFNVKKNFNDFFQKSILHLNLKKTYHFQNPFLDIMQDFVIRLDESVWSTCKHISITYRGVYQTDNYHNYKIRNNKQLSQKIDNWHLLQKRILGLASDQLFVDLPMFKKDLLAHSQQSPFLFVRGLYQTIHDSIKIQQDTVAQKILLEHCLNIISKTNRLYINKLERGICTCSKLRKEGFSCKELRSIKNERQLYNILSLQRHKKIKEDNEIKSIFWTLMEKHAIRTDSIIYLGCDLKFYTDFLLWEKSITSNEMSNLGRKGYTYMLDTSLLYQNINLIKEGDKELVPIQSNIIKNVINAAKNGLKAESSINVVSESIYQMMSHEVNYRNLFFNYYTPKRNQKEVNIIINGPSGFAQWIEASIYEDMQKGFVTTICQTWAKGSDGKELVNGYIAKLRREKEYLTVKLRREDKDVEAAKNEALPLPSLSKKRLAKNLVSILENDHKKIGLYNLLYTALITQLDITTDSANALIQEGTNADLITLEKFSKIWIEAIETIYTPQKMTTFYQENVLPILKDENARREYINDVLPYFPSSILENSLWTAKE